MWFRTALDRARKQGRPPAHVAAYLREPGGVDLKTVQEMMGDKTIAMTAWYAHPAPKSGYMFEL